MDNVAAKLMTDREFTTEELFRLDTLIKNGSNSADVEFLLILVEKFFYRTAELMDRISHLEENLTHAFDELDKQINLGNNGELN
jgi:hypothetical protein